MVLGPVVAGLRDAHPRVRHAALACVGQMTEDFGDWDGGGGEGEEGGSFQGAFHRQVRRVAACCGAMGVGCLRFLCVVVWCVVLWCVVLCCVVLCYVALCCVALCCVVLCCAGAKATGGGGNPLFHVFEALT